MVICCSGYQNATSRFSLEVESDRKLANYNSTIMFFLLFDFGRYQSRQRIGQRHQFSPFRIQHERHRVILSRQWFHVPVSLDGRFLQLSQADVLEHIDRVTHKIRSLASHWLILNDKFLAPIWLFLNVTLTSSKALVKALSKALKGVAWATDRQMSSATILIVREATNKWRAFWAFLPVLKMMHSCTVGWRAIKCIITYYEVPAWKST